MDLVIGTFAVSYEGTLAVGDKVTISGTATVQQVTNVTSAPLEEGGAPIENAAATLAYDGDTVRATAA
jgi:hypothetical protein